MTDLGVLLVHGIGDVDQGNTLSSWGGRLVDELERSGASVRVERSILKPDAGPAHTVLTLNQRRQADDAGQGHESTLTIAESWWAKEFDAPGFLKIFFWSFKSLPWTAVSHCDERFRRASNQFKRSRGVGPKLVAVLNLFLELVWLFFGLVLAPLVLTILLALVVLRIVPYEPSQRAINAVFRVLAGTVGDSYVFTENDVIKAAIVDRVRRDLEWLQGISQRQVVIAHSQGAAVAHLALQAAGPGTGCWLVTFGAGLRKLNELIRLQVWSGPSIKSRLMAARTFAGTATAAAFGAGILMFYGRIRLGIQGSDLFWAAIAIPFCIAAFGLIARMALDWLAFRIGKIFPATAAPTAADLGSSDALSLQQIDEDMRPANRRSRVLNYIGLVLIVGLSVCIARLPPEHNWLTELIRFCFGVEVTLQHGWLTGLIGTLLGVGFTLQMEWRYAAGRASREADHEARERATWREELAIPGLQRWDDIYARKDPVPNGPLLEYYVPDSPIECFAEHQIASWDHLVLDHNTYWGNRRQFVSPIARCLLRLAVGGATPSLPQTPPQESARNVLFRTLTLLILFGTPLAFLISDTFSIGTLLNHFFDIDPDYQAAGLRALMSGELPVSARLMGAWRFVWPGLAFVFLLLLGQGAVDKFQASRIQARSAAQQ